MAYSNPIEQRWMESLDWTQATPADVERAAAHLNGLGYNPGEITRFAIQANTPMQTMLDVFGAQYGGLIYQEYGVEPPEGAATTPDATPQPQPTPQEQPQPTPQASTSGNWMEDFDWGNATKDDILRGAGELYNMGYNSDQIAQFAADGGVQQGQMQDLYGNLWQDALNSAYGGNTGAIGGEATGAYDTDIRAALDNLLGLQSQYPDMPDPKYAPEMADLPEYKRIDVPGYQQTAGEAPDYNPMYGTQDYEAIEQALYDPAKRAATTAYDQGTNNLKNTMGGNGLYGSSVMQNQQTQGLDKVYQNNLADAAANASLNRYQLQGQDTSAQNEWNQGMYNLDLQQEANRNNYALSAAGMQQSDNQNAYSSGFNNAQFQQDYNNTTANWNKQNEQDQYKYQLDKDAWARNVYGQNLNAALAAGGYNSGVNQFNQQMDANQDANDQANLYQGLNALGGLLGTSWGDSTVGGSLWDWGSNLWSS